MQDQDAEILAISLATRVLHSECSIDAGLVRAHSGGALLQFVRNLNTLAGGEFFDFETLKARVLDGVANRAMSGRVEPLELPQELKDRLALENEPPPVSDEPPLKHRLPDREAETGEEEPPPEGTEPDFIEKFHEGLQNLDRKIKEHRVHRDELRRLLFFLEKVQEKRTDPPRPWIGSVLILLLSAFIGGVAFLVTASPMTPALVVMGGAVLAAFLFQREYTWYERLMEIEKADQEHRARNMEIHRKQIEEISSEIHEIRKDALLRIANLEGWEREKAEKMRGDFPSLFKD